MSDLDILIQAITEEIKLRHSQYLRYGRLRSIYLGGGTPSVLSSDQWRLLFSCLSRYVPYFREVDEITIEANPEDILYDRLLLWQDLGVNRLSVGVQAFDNNTLLWMNRGHSYEETLQALNDIHKAEFDNISIDYIFGLSRFTTDVMHDMDIIKNVGVQHISAYALTVEPKTRLYHQLQKGKFILSSEESFVEQFLAINTSLSKQGYEQYEISSYAQAKAFRSVHNSLYWQAVPYIGIGPSAHSYDGNRTRSSNVANNKEYISSIRRQTLPELYEHLDDRSVWNEYIMTRLRTLEGISFADVQRRWGEERVDYIKRRINTIDEDTSYFYLSESHFSCTLHGWLFCDKLSTQLFTF